MITWFTNDNTAISRSNIEQSFIGVCFDKFDDVFDLIICGRNIGQAILSKCWSYKRCTYQT